MTIVLIPIIAVLLGALLWWLAPAESPRMREAGRIIFFCGMLWLVAGRGPSLTIH